MAAVALTAPDQRSTRHGLPGTLRLGLSRVVIELKQFTRIPEQVFFTFLLPVLFLVIFASVFGGDIDGPPGRSVSFVQYFLPGIIASGVVSSTFASLAISISVEQGDGLLKRLSGTPLPKASYLLGKLGLAIVVTAIQTLIMLALGVVAFGASFPEGVSRWLVFLTVLVISAAVGSALGIAYTRAIRNPSAAAAIVQPPFLVLQFISGIFFPWKDLPGWLQAIASVFPMRWMAQGFRYAFLPDWFGESEYGSAWGWERPVMILAGWLALAVVLALAFFRWDRNTDR